MLSKDASILVVDDEVDSCRNLSDILVDLGYHVEVAHDGQAALAKIRNQRFDMALLDLKMPGMDGLTLYRKIKEIRADTVAIVVTAYASSSTAAEALTAGAWQIMSKPVDPAKLLTLMGVALDQPLVMVVDDDSDLCKNLWDLLRERRFRVGVAHDAQQAEEQLTGGHFRVVLIDMKLPQGDGTKVFQLVRKTNPKARTIVITGFRSETEQLVQKVVAEGADAVCYKPFDVPSLLTTLKRLTVESSST
jgi:two-component system, NtrC family, response regulator HydG